MRNALFDKMPRGPKMNKTRVYIGPDGADDPASIWVVSKLEDTPPAVILMQDYGPDLVPEVGWVVRVDEKEYRVVGVKDKTLICEALVNEPVNDEE
jgi:hypothetical protein